VRTGRSEVDRGPRPAGAPLRPRGLDPVLRGGPLRGGAPDDRVPVRPAGAPPCVRRTASPGRAPLRAGARVGDDDRDALAALDGRGPSLRVDRLGGAPRRVPPERGGALERARGPDVLFGAARLGRWAGDAAPLEFALLGFASPVRAGGRGLPAFVGFRDKGRVDRPADGRPLATGRPAFGRLFDRRSPPPGASRLGGLGIPAILRPGSRRLTA
jgi:hypothetical protein